MQALSRASPSWRKITAKVNALSRRRNSCFQDKRLSHFEAYTHDKHRLSKSRHGEKARKTENYWKFFKAPTVCGKILSCSCAVVISKHRCEHKHVSLQWRVSAWERKENCSRWWNALLKHCWLGHGLKIFLLEYDQVCGQRSSREVEGLMQSWSGLFQQTVWFTVSFFFWKMSVKQKQSQSSNSAMPVHSEESLEQSQTCISDTEGECSNLLDCRIHLSLSLMDI